jgi:peptidyl-prolyl cis-trans isomerase C
MGQPAVEPTEERRKQRDREVLMLLIDDVLLGQYLNVNAPGVKPVELDQRLADMAAQLAREGKTLRDFLAETGRTEASLRTFLGQRMQWENFLRQHVSEADVQKYYTEYKDYFDGVLVRASHIVLRLPPDAPEAERQKATAMLNDLRAQILAGKIDFATAAKTYSQCPSAQEGGDLGFLHRKWEVEEPFARAAFVLQVGQVSDVVQTDFGLHLIKVTDRKRDGKPGEVTDFARIKDGVREMCCEDLRQNILGQLRKAARIETNLP